MKPEFSEFNRRYPIDHIVSDFLRKQGGSNLRNRPDSSYLKCSIVWPKTLSKMRKDLRRNKS
eukprot:UN18025